MKPDPEKLTQEAKDVARRFGAVLVGVASIDRFDPAPPYYDRAPRGHHPRDYVPNAKSVISVAVQVLDAPLNAPAVLADTDVEMVPPDIKYPYLEQLYGISTHRTHDYMLEQIGQVVGQHLQLAGFDSMFFPTAGIHPQPDPPLKLTERQIWEGPSKEWAERYSPFRYSFGVFSHRHAATRAGLGEFGYNNIVMTPQFGPRQRFNSIVTEAELVPDPLITEPICLRDACKLCQEACVMGSITLRDDRSHVDYRNVDRVDRDVVFIDTPAKVDPTTCSRRRERIFDSPIRGDCYRICPIPKEPTYLPKRLKEIRGH